VSREQMSEGGICLVTLVRSLPLVMIPYCTAPHHGRVQCNVCLASGQSPWRDSGKHYVNRSIRYFALERCTINHQLFVKDHCRERFISKISFAF